MMRGMREPSHRQSVPSRKNAACFLKKKYLSAYSCSAMMPEAERTMISPMPASSSTASSSQ
jgi:hypothetical protein